ncbi:MAG: DUF3943 domain-containing protein, partial [Thermoanaerobaculia bacterium]|nr:DUF3943 domain-containing protein [Thermoanaerobaculia bacterium]
MTAPAAAQDVGRFEFGIFGGASIGSRISLTPGSDIRIGDAGAFGLRGAYDLGRHFALEATFSHTRPTAVTKSPSTGATLGETPVDVNTYELSALYNYGKGPVRGYFGLGAGVMDFNPVLAASSGSSARFTVSFGAGGKYFVTNRVALRLDGRYRLRATDSRVSTVLCGEDGCKPFTTSFYSNAELTAGLSFRFGGEPYADVMSSMNREPESRRRFWAAAGGVAFFDLVPWAFNRYVSDAEFAHISMDTFRANVTAGFGYDRDSFKTDQSSHPFHGSLFFNSARSNGYSFWESGIFAAAGSFVWELGLEKEPPAINDLVNTTLGGMSRGEVLHRLATMLRDNTTTGSSRFWRELGAGAMDPAGFLTRLTRGELGATGPNPDDRLPGAFRLDGDLGYRHVGGDASNPDQGLLSLSLLYGDPFAGAIQKPFDSFWLGMDISLPATPLMSRFELRGILTGRDLGDASASARPILGVFMEYEYTDNQAQVLGAQIFSAGLLSRYALRNGLSVSTSVTGLVAPLAGVGTTDFLNPLSGRSFDYG